MEDDSALAPVVGANQEVLQAEDPVSLILRLGSVQRKPLYEKVSSRRSLILELLCLHWGGGSSRSTLLVRMKLLEFEKPAPMEGWEGPFLGTTLSLGKRDASHVPPLLWLLLG